MTDSPTTDPTPSSSSTWKAHAWPGPRALLASFSPRPATPSTKVLLRRLSLYAILALRVLVSIAQIAFSFLGVHIGGVIVGCFLAVLNLLFMVWCLAMIERAQGVRHVCGLRVGRTHLDMFLFIAAILHVGLVACTFTIWRHAGVPVNTSWFILWILIAVYGFIGSRPPTSAA